MAFEITEGAVDNLQVYSAHIMRHAYSTYEVKFVLTNDLLDHNIYSSAMFFSDGYVMCKNESDIGISSLARKRLRNIVQYMAVDIIKKLGYK